MEALKLQIVTDGEEQCHLIISHPAQFSHDLIIVMQLMEHIAHRLHKHQEQRQREIRTQIVNSEIRQQQYQVQKIYQEYRAAHYKHRAAVRATMIDSRCCQLKWTLADFNWCSRARFDDFQ